MFDFCVDFFFRRTWYKCQRLGSQITRNSRSLFYLERSQYVYFFPAKTYPPPVLIDEADIFLERRSDNDIVRNAMVGIFLRLLEYHQVRNLHEIS